MARIRTRFSGLALPMGAALLTVLAFLPFVRRDIDTNHDGIMLKPAMDVLAGHTLYRDSFSQYGPLSTYLQVGFLALFGKSLLALRVGTLLMYGVAAAFLVASWRMFLPASLTILAFIFWLVLAPFYLPGFFFLPWSSAYALSFQAVALYFLLKSLTSSRPRNDALLCGAASALAFWCRPSMGLPLIAALAACYWISHVSKRNGNPRAEELRHFALANLAVHAVFVLHLAWGGALDDWYSQNFRWPAIYAQRLAGTEWGIASRHPALAIGKQVTKCLLGMSFWLDDVKSPVRQVYFVSALLVIVVLPTLLAIYLPVGSRGSEDNERPARRTLWGPTTKALAPLGVAVLLGWQWLSSLYTWAYAIPTLILASVGAVVYRWRVRGDVQIHRDDPMLAGLLAGIVGLASWLQYYPKSEPYHIFWALSPAIGVFLFFALRLCRDRVPLVAAGLVILAAPLVAQRAETLAWKLTTPYVKLGGGSALSGMLVPRNEGPRWSTILDAIEDYTRDRRAVTMVIQGPDALYAALVPDLRNPSPLYIDWGEGFVPRLEGAGGFIEANKPLIFVESPRFFFMSHNGFSRIISYAPHWEKDQVKIVSKYIKERFHYDELARVPDTGDLILKPADWPRRQ